MSYEAILKYNMPLCIKSLMFPMGLSAVERQGTCNGKKINF